MTGNTGNGCVKCGHTEVEEGTLSQQDLDYLRCLMCKDNNFKTITCKNCGYTEFYKTNNNRTSDIVDLFFGG